MTKFLIGKAAVLTCAALFLGVAGVACSSNDTMGEESAGSVGMEISLPGGQEIISVHYQITGGPGAGVNLGGDIAVADLAATVSAVIGGLPEGTGYLVTLTAESTDGKVTCIGSAPFDITAGSTTSVTVELSCTADDTTGDIDFDGQFNQCPVIGDFRVAPLSTSPSSPVAVSAAASDADGDVLTFAWSTSGGSFMNGAAAATQYTCAPGVQTVTVSVSDGDPDCDKSQTVEVNCIVLTCGNGRLDGSESCDDGNNVNGDGCNAVCVSERCGDRVINNNGTEQCDDGNTASNDGCSATCQNERCGDGIINGSEQCDGAAKPAGVPASVVCTATCTIPAYCGDAIVNGSEECDDGNAVDADLCGNDCVVNLDPNSCEGCSATNCSAFVSDCYDNAGDPTDKCGAVMGCVAKTPTVPSCAQTTQENCYCGTLSIGLCIALDGIGFNGQPAGKCKTSIEAGAGLDGTEVAGDTGTKVAERYVDPRYPLGRAFRLVNCQRGACSASCGLN